MSAECFSGTGLQYLQHYLLQFIQQSCEEVTGFIILQIHLTDKTEV